MLIGNNGIEDIYVSSFYRFEAPSQSKETIKDMKDIEALVDNYYAMNPSVLAHGLHKIRLAYLPDTYSLEMPLPDALFLTPVYVCHVWEDEGKRGDDDNALLSDKVLFFHAISGDQISLN